MLIVNQKLAQHYWPGQDPIGKRIRIGTPEMQTPWMTVVGEVADVALASPDGPAKEQYYVPIAQTEEDIGALANPATDLNGNGGYIVLRSTLPPEPMENALRQTVRAIDPLLPLTQVQTMEQAVSLSEAPRRFNTVLISSFAFAAVLLAVLGIYSVIAFSVASRVQEMAIRFLYFLVRTKIRMPLAGRFAGIFFLGALQGGLGWYMVKSGLVDDPHVSQYRLTAHLGLAFLIYGAIFWTALDLLSPASPRADSPGHRLRLPSAALAGLIFVMVLSGGMVAGTRAGFVFGTFPLMADHWIPPDLFALDPWFVNFFENLTTVQFDHRLIAWLLALLIPLFWLRTRRMQLPRRARLACGLLVGMLFVQISLGISTLLLGVPVVLAAAHQAGALLLFTAALLTHHEVRRL